MALYDPTGGKKQLTDLRLRLKANGYHPTPNLDKRCVLKGWTSQAYVHNLTDDTIQTWAKEHRGFKATGILVRDGLLPIDFDISDEAVSDQMLGELRRIAPEVHDLAPWRTGNYPKIMVFARWVPSTEYPDMFVREATDKFVDDAGKGHMIEIFGGAKTKAGRTSKQVGAFGPHSYQLKDDGKIDFRKVLREYQWEDDRSLLDIPLDELPALTPAQMWELLAAFERVAIEAGWTRVASIAKVAGQFVYDITELTRFDVENGPQQISYDELCTLDDTHLRVSGSFIDNSKRRPDKCQVSWCYAREAVGAWDYENSAWHLPVWARPLGSEEHAAALAAQLRRLEGLRPPPGSAKVTPLRPRTSDLGERIDWLLQTHAFYAGADKVVELYQTHTEQCLMGKDAFRTLYAAWREETLGPRGGKHPVLATGAWEINERRPSVAGVRMRPDQDYPLYEEHGAFYKNTYRPPAHFGEGDMAPFLAFMERFVPERREREWLFNWLAHKMRRPEVPGTSVWLVADSDEDVIRSGKYGTGRGIFFKILARLFGPEYCTSQEFSVLSGASNQAVYTDWLHYNILVMINEASTSPTAHRRGERRSVYEVLKEVIDPDARVMEFKAKYGKNFKGMTYASIMVGTNHADAAAIPINDRRITALRNGREMTPAEAIELVAWREDPGNIAELARFLAARDLSAFNMYVPLDTATKREMTELAASQVDNILADLAVEANRGLVFTRPYLEQEVEAVLSGGSMRGAGGSAWRGMLEGAWAAHCVVLKTYHGSPVRMRIGGRLQRVYTFRPNLRAAQRLTEAQRRHHVAKWGPVDGIETALKLVIDNDTKPE